MPFASEMNGREEVTCLQCKFFGCCPGRYHYNNAFCVSKRDYFYNGTVSSKLVPARTPS